MRRKSKQQIEFMDTLSDTLYFIMLSNEMMGLRSARNLIGNDITLEQAEAITDMFNDVFSGDSTVQDILKSDDELSNSYIESQKSYNEILSGLSKSDKYVARIMDKTINRLFDEQGFVPFMIHFNSFYTQLSVALDYIFGKATKEETEKNFVCYDGFSSKTKKGDFSLLRRFVRYVQSEMDKTVELEKKKA